MSIFKTARNFCSAIDAGMSVVEGLANAANASMEILNANIEDAVKNNEAERKMNMHLAEEERRLNFYKEKEKLQSKLSRYNENFQKEMDNLLKTLN